MTQMGCKNDQSETLNTFADIEKDHCRCEMNPEEAQNKHSSMDVRQPKLHTFHKKR